MKMLIRDLYQLDGRATTVEQRGELRRRHAPAILEQMRAWMHAQPGAGNHQPRARHPPYAQAQELGEA